MTKELTPLELDILHMVETYGPMDSRRMGEVRLAGAVVNAATEVYDLVIDGYLDMTFVDGDVCVVGTDGPVPFSYVVQQLVNDPEVSVFFDLEGEIDAES